MRRYVNCEEDEEEDAVARAAQPELRARVGGDGARLDQQHAQEDEAEHDVRHRREQVVDPMLVRRERPLPDQPACVDKALALIHFILFEYSILP